MPSEEQKLRSWLIHTITSAARHYSKSRELVQQQNAPQQYLGSGMPLFILEVFEQLENCVAATFRLCMALQGMKSNQAAMRFRDQFETHINELRSLRNQFEHMYNQIVANQTGKGPISMGFGDEGRTITLRGLSMETTKLHGLIEGAFYAIASLYPSFDVYSAPEPHSVVCIKASFSIIECKDGETPA